MLGVTFNPMEPAISKSYYNTGQQYYGNHESKEFSTEVGVSVHCSRRRGYIKRQVSLRSMGMTVRPTSFMWAQFEKEHSRVVECLDQRGKGRNG
jgi:hypothetical protein